MAIRFLGSLAAAFLVSALAHAQTQQPEQLVPVEKPDSDLSLQPIPEILRRHLPILGQRRGVLVESVVPGSAPEKSGIRAGDLLMEAGGRPVVIGDSLGRLDRSDPIVVLRQGRTVVLGPQFRQDRFPTSMFAPLWDPAISSNEGDRALAFSRAGDQISLEMSIPGLSKDPIGFQGTAKDIEDQLRTSTLTESLKRQVRAVLRESR